VDNGLLFSIVGAIVSAGGIFIAIGVMKGKLNQTAEENAVQSKQIETLASKGELAQAISRSDEMLRIMQKRTEEDRTAGEGRYKELYGVINIHGERIAALETSHNAVRPTLDELKLTVNTCFRELREDLKELRKHT
jgi:hypothetical protein